MNNMQILDPVFITGSKVLVLTPYDKKDKSFPKEKIGKSGIVDKVMLEGIIKVKIIYVIFPDGSVNEFFPQELNPSLF